MLKVMNKDGTEDYISGTNSITDESDCIDGLTSNSAIFRNYITELC